MKIVKIFLILLFVPAMAMANVYPNEPEFVFSDQALEECAEGVVKVSFILENGYPTNMRIVSVTPKDMYEKGFRNWWEKHSTWSRRVGQKWSSTASQGEKVQTTFKFKPCST